MMLFSFSWICYNNRLGEKSSFVVVVVLGNGIVII